MRIYIAGPMTGYPEFNQQAFKQAAEILEDEGYSTFNPAVEQEPFDLTGTTGFEEVPDMLGIIKKDLAGLILCDEIFMLQGWEKSTGAKAEHAVALWLGLNIRYQVS